MEYVGEHLLVGQIGHLCAVLSFVAALLAAFAYFFATQHRDRPDFDNWRNVGRFAFLLHGLATLTIIGSLFYILVNKYYEYQYAFSNVSNDLPVQYVFSAFWKEQQGSFLLWSFWHIVLGLVLILRSGRWETSVLATIALAEAFIASMILGIYFGDFRLGASPFDLLREMPEAANAPIFKTANYLARIDGNGLNPLLQNYWMTIHPPTLFLGFASTIVPFAFAIAGLWLKEHTAWLRPALSWSLFSGAILGTGVLMGGAWAYEALSFGGYWAWDPVENSSLVPWIILVAGIHTNLIARATGYSIRSTYAFYLLSFVMVLYSTYLTRSGILGDSSAHAFTEMGLSVQLLLFIGAFSTLALSVWIARYRTVPDVKGEESTTSREFWMLIGSLVLLFSAVLITGATSLPVWNKIVQIFDPTYVGAALKDPIEHHNRYQLWIAVFIGLLSGVGQFTRYQERNWSARTRKFVIHMGIAAAGAGILTALNAQWVDVNAWQLYALLFAGMFAVVSNLDYLISGLKGNLKLAGSVISHVGFGALVLGAMSTGLNKAWISSNSFAMDGLIEGMGNDDLKKNVILMKEAAMPIRDNFEATYQRDTIERQTRTFTINFKKRDLNGNYTGETFTLQPNVMYDRQFSKVVASNPSTQHYWNYDIFTTVSSLPKAELDPEYAKQQEDSLRFEPYEAIAGDTIFTKKHFLVVESVTKSPTHPEYHPEKGDLAFGLQLKAYALDEPQGYLVAPMLYLRPGKGAFTLAAQVGQLQMKVRLTEASMERLLKAEDELKYQDFQVAEGGGFQFGGYQIRFLGADRNIKSSTYIAEPNDIAVAANLEITAPDGQKAQAAPVYLIRGNQPFSLKDDVPALGLHFRFESIDPKKGLLTIGVAQSGAEARKIPLEIAENAARSDYIVLEAIVFPGINLVWLGSIMMMFGLAFSLIRRLREKSVRA